MQLFFAVFVMDGGDQHPAGVDAHHGPRRQIRDGDAGLADQFFRLVVFVDAGKNDSVRSRTVIQHEFQEFLGLFDRLTRFDLHSAEIGLGERFEVDEILKERLDLDVGEVDLLLRGRRSGRGFRLRSFLLRHVEGLHCGEYYPGIIITSHKFL